MARHARVAVDEMKGLSAQGLKSKGGVERRLKHSLTIGIFTWNRALRRDALRLLPHGEWHASGDHERRGHDARPFHGSRWRGVWPLLCDGGPHVHGAPPLLYDVLRFVGSYGF